MKKIYIFLLLIMAISILSAQEKQFRTGFGIKTDYLILPLQNKALLLQTSAIYGVLGLNKRINFKLGCMSNSLKNENLKQYENYNGIFFSAGYSTINKKNFSTEFFLSFENTFDDFFTANNHCEELGVNFYMFKVFYLGTGIKFFRYTSSDFYQVQQNNFNWYWQMGCQLYIGKNK